MDIRTLHIETLEQALEILQSAIEGDLDERTSYEFDFGDWLEFSFKVEGDDYQSSLPASTLKALAQYQAAINNFYASLVYSKTAQSLTDEDKKDIELIFHFSEGSSIAKAPLKDTIENLGLKAIEKMDGSQLVITILGLALVASIYAGHANYLDAGTERHSTDANLAVMQMAIESNTQLAQATTEIAASTISMAKSVSDADAIELGNLKLSADEIPDYIRRDREKRHNKRLDGQYRVTRIAETDGGYRVGLSGDKGMQVTASLPMDGERSQAILSNLLNSVAKKQAVELDIMAKVKSGVPVDAFILTGPTQSTLSVEVDENDS